MSKLANFTPQEIEEILQQFFDVTGKRQYVGARYVPIFGRRNEDNIDWDNSGAYEPLTIVLYNGDSYTSKRYVPAGVDISDTDYWVITGRYNAQVEQYRQEVLGFSDRIDQNADDIDSLGSIIPSSEFDSTNTVKAYIDAENITQNTELKNILIPFPDPNHYPKLGLAGQVLSTLADGTTKWENPVVPSDAQAEQVITEWLDAHPEATTTVQNGAITNAKLAQTGGILSAVKSGQVCVLMGATSYVNYDTTQKTITFPNDSVIVRKLQNGNFTYKSLQGSERVIDVEVGVAVSTTAIKLYYDTSTQTVKPIASNASVPEDYFYLCAIRLAGGGYTPAFTADFPWAINGAKYDITIQNGEITNAKLAQTGGILSAVKSGQVSVLMGVTSYMNYDTTQQTITFPNDTVIVRKLQNGNFTYKSLWNESCVVDVTYGTAVTTSAIKLYYDTATQMIKPIAYNASVPENYLYLCAVRLASGGYQPAVSADFPWSINGNAYGIELPEIPTATNYMPYIAESYGNGVNSINHRGYNQVAPENTIPAYKLSCEHNFLKVECDVEFTSDNVAVLLHDDTINRTARNNDGTALTETVYINDITYAQALTYDFGIWKGQSYAGTRIPSLEQFLVFCRNTGLHPYIEIKSSASYQQNQIEGIVDLVNACGMRGKCSYISFSSEYLGYIKNYDSSARLGFVCGTVTQQVITTVSSLNTTSNEVFVDTNDTASTAVTLCKNNRVPMERWTINELETIYALDPYISGVTSDLVNACEALYTHQLSS